jgi:ketosteroid isomerase-like protein
MSTMTINASRTAHLLELMKKGDDAFNSRDFAAMNAAHHPDIIAHIMGIPDPIVGRVAHAAMIQQMISVCSPTSTSTTTHIQSSSEAAIGSP